MEESTATLLATAMEDELIVSEVLLSLRVMFSLLESLSTFNWGRRRRRSALDAPPPLSPAPAPSSPPNRVVVDVQVKVEADVGRMQVKGGDDEAKANTASPDTPLALPAPSSESDDKQQFNHHSSSRKRSREGEEEEEEEEEKCVGMLEELTKQRDVLRGEAEKVKQHYKELKAYNSELKAMRQKVLNSGPSMELEGKSSLEISRGGVNPGVELAQHYQTTTLAHQQPLIGAGDRTPQSHQCSFGGQIATQMQSSSNYGLGSANHVGPLGIDLNISAEEALGLDPWQPLDPLRASLDERARCAEARRIRSAKIKSMRRSGSGNRLPRTR